MALDEWLNYVEADLIDWYNNSDHRDINSVYRETWTAPIKWIFLSKALNKLKSYIWTVYRWEQMTNEKFNEVYWGLKEWDIMTKPAFTSSSLNKWYAFKEFWWVTEDWKLNHPAEKNILFTIESKNWKYTFNSSEREILFDAWTKYKILELKDLWNIVYFTLEEL